jgi:hypothetical protein
LSRSDYLDDWPESIDSVGSPRGVDDAEEYPDHYPCRVHAAQGGGNDPNDQGDDRGKGYPDCRRIAKPGPPRDLALEFLLKVVERSSRPHFIRGIDDE